MIVVICGVSGVGKSTVGKLLAEDLDWVFFDADDFHPPANVEKMRAGTPLDDDDRTDWLTALRELIERLLAENKSAVLACSALRECYRERLRVGDEVEFVLLNAPFAAVEERLGGRKGHFMNPELLRSQFETLEIPASGILVVDAAGLPAEIVKQIKKAVLCGTVCRSSIII